MLVAGVVAGLTYGVAAGDVGGKLADGRRAPPRCNCPRSGCSPRWRSRCSVWRRAFTPVAWGVLVGFIALYLIGSLSGFPQWVLDLEPFAHIPLVTGGNFTAVPLLWLLAIDAGADRVGRRGIPPPRRADVGRSS